MGRNKQDAGIGRYCPSCGKKTDTGDRFCRSCGKSLTGERSAERVTPRFSALRLAGIAVIVLAGLYAFLYYGVGTSRDSEPPAQPIPFSDVGGAAAPSPPTGREMADQLYNQAMTAHESGDSANAARFIPMALAAYRGLESPDLDARYHVALLNLAAGRPDAALAQADTMLAQVPDHLLGLGVAARVFEAKGDRAQASEYYRRFLDAYSPATMSSRPEYLEHARGLEAQLETAQRLIR